jgi:hypothetical protein
MEVHALPEGEEEEISLQGQDSPVTLDATLL